jgi:uncharacterized tellurite resistance protein B-like protein
MFRRFLRLGGDDQSARAEEVSLPESAVGDTATVRRIVARLEAMPPDEARYLAGFAYVMSRAAHADLDISETETRAMERAVLELGGLDEAQAVLVVQIAKLQARSHGETEDFVVTREFSRIATLEQKLALLRCCFLVAVADGSISADEASVVNQIARELDVARQDLNEVREEFVERFSAIQALRRREQAAG